MPAMPGELLGLDDVILNEEENWGSKECSG